MPPEAALGMMMNLNTANAWKTIPILQGIGLSIGGKDSLSTFIPTLVGKTPSVQDQIRSSFNEIKREKR